MNYKKLLKGKSIDEIKTIADNWYQRAHRLKEVFYAGNAKAEPIFLQMVGRVLALGQILANATQPKPNYPKGTNGGIDIGSAIVGEEGAEPIINPTPRR